MLGSTRSANFSREGQWICYVSHPDGSLWRSRVDGSDKLQLTTSEFSARGCTSSPGGHLIAVDISKPATRELIYLISSDGSAIRELSVGKFNLVYPSWAPDDHSLISPRKKWSQLTESAVGHFEWSADGKFVYFDNGFNADLAVCRIRLSEQKTERIVGLKDLRRVVRPWNTWFGISPQDDLLFMRDTDSQEVYALDFDLPGASTHTCTSLLNYPHRSSGDHYE